MSPRAKLSLRPYEVKLYVEGAIDVELLAASAEDAMDSALAQAAKYVGNLYAVSFKVVDARVKP